MKPFLSSIINLIYPTYCLRCFKKVDNKYACQQCINSIEKINPLEACLKCGMHLGKHSDQKNNCTSCKTIHFPFKKTIAFAKYDNTLKDLIVLYKYNKQKLLSETLAELLMQRINQEPDIINQTDLIVSVPLTRKKKRKRGFNQTELLANYLAKKLNRPVSEDNLIRIKELPPQVILSRAERINSLKDAFDIKTKSEFNNKNILLVDDVLTTGATASEVSRTLKKAGAKCVYVLVLGR